MGQGLQISHPCISSTCSRSQITNERR